MDNSKNAWCSDYSEVLAFAHVLNDHGGYFAEPGDVLHYFEKPYKWSDERERWVENGRKPGDELPEDFFAGLS